MEVEGRTLRLTNLGKVLYPRTGTTKAEVLDYYARIAPVLLPHLRDRAVTRIRWPHGTGEASFFEKNVPAGTPSWVRTWEVRTTGSRGSGKEGVIRFPLVDDLATLTWLVNLAALELHVHQWTVPSGLADRLVLDLDPGEPAGLHECARVALLLRERLRELGLDAHPVTSGSKGIHLYVMLPEPTSSEITTGLAKQLAEELEAAHGALVTATMTKSRRGGKVFLDWSQNAASKTTVSPYSLRGKDRPYVAAPLTWDEVAAGAEDPLALEQLTAAQVLERVDRLGDLLARHTGG